MSWDSAVTRESAWFTAEPPASFPAALPLLRAVDATAPFDTVQARRPYLHPRMGRHLYIYRDYRKPQQETVEASGIMLWIHHFVAHMVWTFNEPTRQAEDMEQHLETAIARVKDRIRGPGSDHTHGGIFSDVAADAMAGSAGSDMDVEFLGDPIDAIRDRSQVEVLVAYSATDPFFAT
jgi:hypothetical protein